MQCLQVLLVLQLPIPCCSRWQVVVLLLGTLDTQCWFRVYRWFWCWWLTQALMDSDKVLSEWLLQLTHFFYSLRKIQVITVSLGSGGAGGSGGYFADGTKEVVISLFSTMLHALGGGGSC